MTARIGWICLLAGVLFAAGPFTTRWLTAAAPPQEKKAAEPPAKSPQPSQDKKAPTDQPNLPDGDWSLRRVGKDQPLHVNGQLILPAGQTLKISGSTRGMALARQGKFLLAKTSSSLAVIDAATFKLVKQWNLPDRDGGSMHGLAVTQRGDLILVPSKNSKLHFASLDEDGQFVFLKPLELGTEKNPIYPLGVAVFDHDRAALLSLSIANQVAVVDLATKKIARTIDVGVCPYGVAVSPDDRWAYVSNFGGPHPRAGDKTEKSAGSPVAVDARSVALRGSVSVVDLQEGKVVAEIETRIHPESLVLSPDGKLLYVVDASGDGVSVIDTAARKVVRKLSTKPREDLPYGSLSDALALSPDGNTLYVASGGNNAIAVFDLASESNSPQGLIPAGAFPGSLCLTERALMVGNVDGFGGDLQKVELPIAPAELKKYTAAAENGFHFPQIVRSLARAQAGVSPKPVPDTAGEPSPLKHVVYIIKENKKYDQVLGDMGRGASDPKLCEFPRKITPNAHAMCDQFVLLDNYYCCSGNSATGHQWAVQGLVTPYRVKGEAPRVTYDFGVDPLTYAGCGFLWDHALRQGISFRNFGELDFPKKPKAKTWFDYYADWQAKKTKIEFESGYNVSLLQSYSDLRYPGWEMSIPDQMRADVFLTALAEYEKAGKLPELIIIYLPNDHTARGKDFPTPRSFVADNDLALGRIVHGLSHSPFWKDMAILVNEDDPQTGADHISGYRSVCYVASPYARRGALVSRFYNQASVLHTICNILGIPPMNQSVAGAPLMSDCFADRPDFAPFELRPAEIALNERTGDPKTASAREAELLKKTANLNFSAPDQLRKSESEALSRYIWYTVRGDEPFPIEFWGPHDKGLAALGLSLEKIGAEPDDDDD